MTTITIFQLKRNQSKHHIISNQLILNYLNLFHTKITFHFHDNLQKYNKYQQKGESDSFFLRTFVNQKFRKLYNLTITI